MALGEFKLFQFKSKAQREKEEKEYASWAFPYGDLQRENLTALISELKPKEPSQMLLFSYLTCKEIHKNASEDSESREETIAKMMSIIKRYKQLIKKSDVNMYLAIVLADAEIDERCEYPSADEIRASIQELDEFANKKKG